MRRNINLLVKETFTNYKNTMAYTLYRENPKTVTSFIKKLLKAKKIFLSGNGGSMSTAKHIALDWEKVGKHQCVVLGNSEHITAYGNDLKFEDIFYAQLQRHQITRDDVILLISASGESPNIRKVINTYPRRNIMGMSGKTGYLRDMASYCLCANSEDVRIIEDSHLCYGHCITALMERLR